MHADEEMTLTKLTSSPLKLSKTATRIQAAHNELEKRSIIVYGVSQSKAEVAADRVQHDIELLELYFKRVLAKDESITHCKAYRVGTLHSNSANKPRAVKIILLVNRRRMLHSVMPDKFFSQELQQVRTV